MPKLRQPSSQWYESLALVWVCPPLPIWFVADRFEAALSCALWLGAICLLLLDLSVSHGLIATILWGSAIIHAHIVTDQSPTREGREGIQPEHAGLLFVGRDGRNSDGGGDGGGHGGGEGGGGGE